MLDVLDVMAGDSWYHRCDSWCHRWHTAPQQWETLCLLGMVACAVTVPVDGTGDFGCGLQRTREDAVTPPCFSLVCTHISTKGPSLHLLQSPVQDVQL